MKILRLLYPVVLFILGYGVSPTEAQNVTATLAWTPPTTNSDGSPITGLSGYRLKRSAVSGNYANAVVTPIGIEATQIAVSGLSFDTNYYFVVTAINSSNLESAPSNEVTFRRNSVSPTPVPTPSATATATPMPTISPTPVPTVSPTVAPTSTPAPTVSPTPVSTATPTPTVSPSPVPSETASPSPTPKLKGRSSPKFKGGITADSFATVGESYVVQYAESQEGDGSDSSGSPEAKRIVGAVAIELGVDGSEIEYVRRSRGSYLFQSINPVTKRVRTVGTVGVGSSDRPVAGCGLAVKIDTESRRLKRRILRVAGTRDAIALPLGTERVICARDDQERLHFLALTKRGREFALNVVGTKGLHPLPRGARNISILRIPPNGGSPSLFAVLYLEGGVIKRALLDESGAMTEPVPMPGARGKPSVIGYEDETGYFALFYRNKRFTRVGLE